MTIPIIPDIPNEVGGGAGTEYTDGGTPPANPIGTALVFDNSGTWVDVGADHPLPISGSISATNPSVGTDGAAIPASSTLLGGSDGINLQPLQVDGSKNLKVVQQGNVTEANSAAIKSDLDTIATNTNKIPASPAQEAGNLATLVTNTADLLADGDHLATIDSGIASLVTNTADLLADGDNLATIATNTSNTATNTSASKTDLDTLVTNTADLLADGDHLATIDSGIASLVTNTADLLADGDNLATISTNTANIPAKGTAVMTGSTPVTIATNDTVFAELLLDTDNLATTATNTSTIAGAISSGKAQVNVAQIGGQAAAMAGSDGQTAVNVPMQGMGVYNGSTVDRLVGLNGIGTFQDLIRYQTLQGKSYNVTTGRNNSPASGNVGFQLFNPASSGKNILIYSLILGYNSANWHAMTMTTANVNTITGWSGNDIAITPVNNKAGGGASSATSSYTNTNVTGTQLGTVREITGSQNNLPIETLTNGECIFLPSAGSINGIAVYLTIGAAASWFITCSYLEY